LHATGNDCCLVGDPLVKWQLMKLPTQFGAALA